MDPFSLDHIIRNPPFGSGPFPFPIYFTMLKNSGAASRFYTDRLAPTEHPGFDPRWTREELNF